MNENVRNMYMATQQKYHSGDKVMIPGRLISRDEPAEAVIQKIYPHHVSFKIVRAGYMVSLTYDELKEITVIEKYDDGMKNSCNMYADMFRAIDAVNDEWNKIRPSRNKKKE